MPRQNCNSMAVFAVTVYSVFTSLAEHALKIIQEIYRTEHFADSREYTPEERSELRNRQSAPPPPPLLDSFEK